MSNEQKSELDVLLENMTEVERLRVDLIGQTVQTIRANRQIGMLDEQNLAAQQSAIFDAVRARLAAEKSEPKE